MRKIRRSTVARNNTSEVTKPATHLVAGGRCCSLVVLRNGDGATNCRCDDPTLAAVIQVFSCGECEPEQERNVDNKLHVVFVLHTFELFYHAMRQGSELTAYLMR